MLRIITALLFVLPGILVADFDRSNERAEVELDDAVPVQGTVGHNYVSFEPMLSPAAPCGKASAETRTACRSILNATDDVRHDEGRPAWSTGPAAAADTVSFSAMKSDGRFRAELCGEFRLCARWVAQ